MWGRVSSPVMWEGPPTERIERSGKVNGIQGRGLGVKKRLRKGKLHFCSTTPVQPVSAMSGVRLESESGESVSESGSDRQENAFA